jgi:hypothetical protein
MSLFNMYWRKCGKSEMAFQLRKWAMKKINRYVEQYWLEHYTLHGLCSLCGNSGRIKVTYRIRRYDEKVERSDFCICPNGQTLRWMDQQQREANNGEVV